MRPRRAFTLIEIVITVFILMLVLLLAVPSLNGVLADKRLRRSLDGFNNLVRQAQERSVAERIFWPSGTCEPAVVEFNGRDGSWSAHYSALSARAELTSYAAR